MKPETPANYPLPFPEHQLLQDQPLAKFEGQSQAHSITGNDANFVQDIDGPAVMPFIYLGAKHMVTGYDHLLYLIGVVFFLYRPAQVVQYVTLFAVGHSITLLTGVLANLQVNAYLIDVWHVLGGDGPNPRADAGCGRNLHSEND